MFKVTLKPVSAIVRRMLDDVPGECPDGCGAVVLRGNQNDHGKASCPSEPAKRRRLNTVADAVAANAACSDTEDDDSHEPLIPPVSTAHKYVIRFFDVFYF